MIWANNRANNAGRFETCPYGNDNHHKWHALQIMDSTFHNYAFRIMNYPNGCISQQLCITNCYSVGNEMPLIFL